MKKVKLSLPKNKVDAFVDFTFANEIRILISFTEGGEWFDAVKVVCICAMADDKVAAFQASEFNNFVQK
jgi:hypothetical protein